MNKEIINREYFDYSGALNFTDVSTHLRQLGEETAFILNDILFPIPPISIQIQKDNFNWGYKTLRSKTTTKVISGRSSVGVQIKLLFNREMILMLHRLIIQIRNNPFVWVKNDYIKNAILELDPNLGNSIQETNLFCTVVGFRISSYQASVSSFEAELDLKYFNYYPYSPNLMFRQELESLLIESADKTFTSFIFPVFNPTKFASINYTLLRESTPEATTDTTAEPVENKNYFTSMYKNLRKYNFSMAVKEPYFSNVYVRYYNYLQIKSLIDNYGINCLDQSFFSKEEMKHLESGIIGENFQNIVIGLHSAYIPEETKEKIILEMIKKDENIKIYYNEYYYLNLPGEVLANYRREILHGTEGIQDEVAKKAKILDNQKKIAAALKKIATK